MFAGSASGFVLLLPHSTQACAMCMGAKDTPIAPAVNASIFLLLGVLAVVAGCFLRFLIHLARHDHLAAEPGPAIEPPFSS